MNKLSVFFSSRKSWILPYIIFSAIFVVIPLLLIVVYAFTDDNGHLNNTQYADILLDNLPFSATVEKTLRKMVINYHSEAKMGEELSIFVKELDEETIKAPMIGYYVSGENESGKKCFEGLAVFES